MIMRKFWSARNNAFHEMVRNMQKKIRKHCQSAADTCYHAF